MKNSPRFALSLLPLLAGCAGQGQPPAQQSPAATLGSEDEKTAYTAGVMLGRNLAALNLSPSELEATKRGLADAATGKTPVVDLQTYGPKVQAMMQTRMATKSQGEKDKGKAYCANAAKEQGVSTAASGLVFKTLHAGKGGSPKPTDTVRVHYRGTLIDGSEFDNSIKRGQPAEFALNGVIPCWTEGVQKMKVGEKARLVCPSDIAYGDQGRPGIPGGATLDFEVELLDIVRK
jgi:FKBP-type peptidyl-prolyl cis-trans isomerase FkpA